MGDKRFQVADEISEILARDSFVFFYFCQRAFVVSLPDFVDDGAPKVSRDAAGVESGVVSVAAHGAARVVLRKVE